MKHRNELTEITDSFVMNLGASVLQDVDTPSFMRKEYDIALVEPHRSREAGKVVEPDEKIIDFLSVIKRKEELPLTA